MQKLQSQNSKKLDVWSSHFLGFPLIVLRFMLKFGIIRDSNVLFVIVLFLTCGMALLMHKILLSFSARELFWFMVSSLIAIPSC